MALRSVFGPVQAVADSSSAHTRATGGGSATFSLATGEVARLPRQAPHSVALRGLLDEASATQVPVLVEVDAINEITEVHVPLPADSVTSVTPLDPDTLQVELMLSQKRHLLRRSRPDFDRLRATLEAALNGGTRVFVTTSDEGIIHVEDTGVPFASTTAAQSEVEAEPLQTRAAVSLDEAKAFFARVAEITCDPRNPSGECITFLFPDDGCYARAHEMCRLIGPAKTGKAWIYGSLRARTRNHPDCSVPWRYHVAPTVPVKTGANVMTYILDPSLFPGPVPVATWKGAQGDTAATLVETGAEPFYRAPSGGVQKDPSYVETKKALAAFRLALKDRSAKKGPPPYAKCPAASTGEAAVA